MRLKNRLSCDWRAEVVGRQFRVPYLLLFLVLVGARLNESHAACSRIPPLEVTLSSAEPSSIPANDWIWVDYYPAVRSSGQPAPAVVLLHPLAETRMKLISRFARYLAARGIGGRRVGHELQGNAVPFGQYHLSRPLSQRSIHFQLRSELDDDVGVQLTKGLSEA